MRTAVCCKRNRAFSGVSFCILALAVLSLPTVASAQATAYTAVIKVLNSSGTSLGYVQRDLNYWTPLLTSDKANADVVGFTLANGQTGTGINLTIAPFGTFTLWGLVEGRDNTSPDIGTGSFHYLYLDPMGPTPTAADATPQSVPSFFSTSTGLDKKAESAVWSIDVTAKTLAPQWVNSGGSKPSTQVFIQSNHVYAGGDANAFHSRFPAPVSLVTLQLEILTTVPLFSFTSLTATPNVLWPANHKMVPVSLNATTSGGSGPISCTITSVSSSEPTDPEGDWQIFNNLNLTLRADRLTSRSERSSDGRVYTITVSCTDGSSSATKTTTVQVPLNRGQ
jgi:hypothetical protein